MSSDDIDSIEGKVKNLWENREALAEMIIVSMVTLNQEIDFLSSYRTDIQLEGGLMAAEKLKMLKDLTNPMIKNLYKNITSDAAGSLAKTTFNERKTDLLKKTGEKGKKLLKSGKQKVLDIFNKLAGKNVNPSNTAVKGFSKNILSSYYKRAQTAALKVMDSLAWQSIQQGRTALITKAAAGSGAVAQAAKNAKNAIANAGQSGVSAVKGASVKGAKAAISGAISGAVTNTGAAVGAKIAAISAGVAAVKQAGVVGGSKLVISSLGKTARGACSGPLIALQAVTMIVDMIDPCGFNNEMTKEELIKQSNNLQEQYYNTVNGMASGYNIETYTPLQAFPAYQIFNPDGTMDDTVSDKIREYMQQYYKDNNINPDNDEVVDIAALWKELFILNFTLYINSLETRQQKVIDQLVQYNLYMRRQKRFYLAKNLSIIMALTFFVFTLYLWYKIMNMTGVINNLPVYYFLSLYLLLVAGFCVISEFNYYNIGLMAIVFFSIIYLAFFDNSSPVLPKYDYFGNIVYSSLELLGFSFLSLITLGLSAFIIYFIFIEFTTYETANDLMDSIFEGIDKL